MNIKELIAKLNSIHEHFCFDGSSKVAKDIANALLAQQVVIEQMKAENAALKAENDELRVQFGHEPQYKNAYLELSGKTGELEDRIKQQEHAAQKLIAERDQFQRERDILVRSNTKLKAELAAAQKDAERYRWLTQACGDLTPLLREYHSGVCFPEELDAAIDKEMEK